MKKNGLALYDGIFHNHHTIMLLIDPESGGILDANPPACSFYGYTREKLISLKVFELNTMPETQVRKEMHHAAEGKKTRFAFRHRLANGAVRDVEVQSGPIEVEGRELLFSVIHDVSERKQVEQALVESQERLNLALNSSGMATFDWDIIANNRIWDDCVHSLLGTTPEDFTGTADEFFRVIHPEDRNAVQAALSRAVETTGVYETEYRAVWPDGTIRHIAARGKVHRDSAGRAERMTGVCWDSTDRKLAEEALEKLNEELENRVTERTGELTRTVATLLEEIMERKQAEERLQRLNRLYAVLSETNQAIVRTKERDTLFNDFCRIAVEDGSFKLA